MNWTRTLALSTFAATSHVAARDRGVNQLAESTPALKRAARGRSRMTKHYKEITFAHTIGVFRCSILFCSLDGASVFRAEQIWGFSKRDEFPSG
jgi:hypothetical protein